MATTMVRMYLEIAFSLEMELVQLLRVTQVDLKIDICPKEPCGFAASAAADDFPQNCVYHMPQKVAT
jgi:hypothetical protein